MDAITIRLPKYVASYIVSIYGYPVFIKNVDPLYDLILLSIQSERNKYEKFQKIKRDFSNDVKVDIILPSRLKQDFGAFTPIIECRIRKFLYSYFKKQFISYILHRNELGREIKSSIYEFIDRFHIDESIKSFETLNRYYFRYIRKYLPEENTTFNKKIALFCQ